MTTARFEAWNLDDPQLLGRRSSDIHQGLHLEPIARRMDDAGKASPEGVVPVTKIRVFHPPDTVHDADQDPVPESSDASDVLTSPANGEPGPFGEVVSTQERVCKPRDFGRVRGAIGIEQH